MGHRWLPGPEVLTRRPCKLLGLLVTPSAADAECKVYNGESTADPVAFEVFLTTRNTKSFSFPGGLELDRGLYVGSFTNMTGVLVSWEAPGKE